MSILDIYNQLKKKFRFIAKIANDLNGKWGVYDPHGTC